MTTPQPTNKKDIKIEYVQIRVPATIEVDGIKYPRNQRNLDVVHEYELTNNEDVLDRLVNFSISFDGIDV